jgi:hypothetical protein
MDDAERPDTSDEFDAEVSDMRPRAGGAEAAPARSPLEPWLTPRRRRVRLAVVMAAGLALLVVLGSIPAVRDDAARLAGRLLPLQTPTLAPGSDLFYLLPNPPGVVVSLDGRTLAEMPPPSDFPAHPLRLAPGSHVFAWRSRIFPFLPLQCAVSVPPAPSDTCPVLLPQQLPAEERSAPGRLIALHADLDALPDALPTDAGAQLEMAVQNALDGIRSTALVQPGEYFYSALPNETPSGPSKATQPLRVTLSYRSTSLGGYPDPCVVSQLALPCRFPGQNCLQLCTVAQPPAAVASTSNAWIAAALVSSRWRYTTLGGPVVVAPITDAVDGEIATLRITWDGATWHVTPLVGSTPGLPVADDLVCDPARYWLELNGKWGFMLTNPPTGARVVFVSDATPTDGCLVVLDPFPGSDAPAALLEHFGVLLAVNDAANRPGANLPMAGSAEQNLAHRLAGQAQLTF